MSENGQICPSADIGRWPSESGQGSSGCSEKKFDEERSKFFTTTRAHHHGLGVNKSNLVNVPVQNSRQAGDSLSDIGRGGIGKIEPDFVFPPGIGAVEFASGDISDPGGGRLLE
jgi:hypothetical protein